MVVTTKFNVLLPVGDILLSMSDKKEEKKIIEVEHEFNKLLRSFINQNYVAIRLGAGFFRNFTVTNNIPLTGSNTLNLVVTTMDPTNQTSWGDELPVAWKVVLFNRNSVPALFTYQDNYQLTTAQIDTNNMITPGTSQVCQVGDQYQIDGSQNSPLWTFNSNSGGNPINAKNNVKLSNFNIGFIINNQTAVVKTQVNYLSVGNFNPTPKLYFTVVSQIQQSQVLTSAVASQTFMCDMSKYTQNISPTIFLGSDGSTQIAFS